MQKKSITFMLGELPFMAVAIRKLSEREVPAKTAYRLAKIGRAVQEELDDFEQTRLRLVEQHAMKDERGAAIRGAHAFEFAPEEREVFEGKYQELAKTETTIEVTPIRIEELEGITIATRDLLALERFIEEGGD